MARLHHITVDTVVAQRPRTGPATLGPTWKPSHPTPLGAIDVWFSLTPSVPSVDNLTGLDSELGVAATLETFGGVTGPTAARPGSEPFAAVLGGQAVAAATPAPATVDEFARHSHARLALAAQGLGAGRQCLIIAALRATGPTERAAVQLFAGTQFIGEDAVHGDERIAVLIDVPENGRLALDLRLRLVGGPATRVAILGVQGHRL